MDVSMLAKEYPTIEPEPWAYDDDFSSGATEEVKKRWQKESQIRGEYPCRKIVFKIKSHDQGWGGNREHKGTYKGSYTWFEAGKETVTVVRESQLPPTEIDDPALYLFAISQFAFQMISRFRE